VSLTSPGIYTVTELPSWWEEEMPAREWKDLHKWKTLAAGCRQVYRVLQLYSYWLRAREEREMLKDLD